MINIWTCQLMDERKKIILEATISDYIETDENSLNKIAKLLSEKLEGKNLSGINETLFAELVSELPLFKGILSDLYKEVKLISNSIRRSRKMSIKGVSKML